MTRLTEKHHKNLSTTVMELIDGIVELYLQAAIQPFVQSVHEPIYDAWNRVMHRFLNSKYTLMIVECCTATKTTTEWKFWIPYVRTALVLPLLVLLSLRHTVVPSILVLIVHGLGSLLHGVVDRYDWIDPETKTTEKKRSESPTNSDDGSFEVVTSTGSPHAVSSWTRSHRQRTFGGFADSLCEKAFIIPCWIALLQYIPSASYFVILQYIVLLALILAETYSACIRHATFYLASGMPAPIMEGYDLSDSKVTTDHVGKAKQTFGMVGTALFMLSFTRYVGLVLLIGAVPLAYESVRRQLVRRVVYVLHASDTLDHNVLKFWMQIAAISSSSLVVGVPSNKSSDVVRNACAVACVDQVIAEAPATKVDSAFLDAHHIDFVVLAPGQTKFFTEDVVHANRVLAMGDDGILRPIHAKVEGKKE